MTKFATIAIISFVSIFLTLLFIKDIRPHRPILISTTGMKCVKDGEFIINLPIIIKNTKVGMYESLRPSAQYSMTLEEDDAERKSLEFYYDEKSTTKYKVVGKIVKIVNGGINVKTYKLLNQELFQSMAYGVLLNYDGDQADYIWPRLQYIAKEIFKNIAK
jgi:hypothetical protein